MQARLMALWWTALFLTGAAFVVYGVARWSHPAGWVVAGLILAIIGFLSGIDQARHWMDKDEE